MKTFIFGAALVLATLLSLPTTSDAWSRRSGSTELGPQSVTVPVQNTTTTSAQAVPEPPVLLLMSIGVGVFGLGYAIQRFRKQS